MIKLLFSVLLCGAFVIIINEISKLNSNFWNPIINYDYSNSDSDENLSIDDILKYDFFRALDEYVNNIREKLLEPGSPNNRSKRVRRLVPPKRKYTFDTEDRGLPLKINPNNPHNTYVDYESNKYEWYMVERRILMTACCALATCNYFFWQFNVLLIRLNDTVEPGRYMADREMLVNQYIPMWKKNVEKYAFASAWPYRNTSMQFSAGRFECSWPAVYRCERKLHDLTYEQCAKTQELLSPAAITCNRNEHPVEWNMFRIAGLYFGNGPKFSVHSAWKYVARFLPSHQVYASHGYLNRVVNKTRRMYNEWQEDSLNTDLVYGPCQNSRFAECIYIRKAYGHPECYDENLIHIPCWGSNFRPMKVSPNRRFGVGGRKASSAEVPPYVSDYDDIP